MGSGLKKKGGKGGYQRRASWSFGPWTREKEDGVSSSQLGLGKGSKLRLLSTEDRDR